MGAYLIVILVPLYLVAGWVAITWIKARYGRPREAEADRPLADLAERICVLEQIVTDRRRQLSQEIEELRK